MRKKETKMALDANYINNLWDELRNTPDEVLCKWWCELNRWNWPSELIEWKPENNRNSYYIFVMDLISHIVGHKKVNRMWNDDMTDKEHEIWYSKYALPPTWSI